MDGVFAIGDNAVGLFVVAVVRTAVRSAGIRWAHRFGNVIPNSVASSPANRIPCAAHHASSLSMSNQLDR
jgi:hypothetical protein